MDLVIAAAGRGSRFKSESYDGPKALYEIDGKALVGHILDQIQSCTEVKRLVVVGATGSPDSGKIFEYLKDYGSDTGINVSLIEGERRGFGHALWLGAREMLNGVVDSTVMLMPCDTILESYQGIASPSEPIGIALSPIPLNGPGKYSTVRLCQDGTVDFSKSDSVARSHIMGGIYSLEQEVLPRFESLLHEVVTDASVRPDVLNPAGEFRITWIWPALASEGFRTVGIESGSLAEINTRDQIPEVEAFLARIRGDTAER